MPEKRCDLPRVEIVGGQSEAIESIVAAALQTEVRASQRLSGGDFASSHRVELADGSLVFAKTHGDPPPLFFTTEAAGLEWLRSTGTVPVPRLLFASDSPPLLVLEWIEESLRSHPDEESFGRSLAALHRTRFGSFGRPDGRTTGSQALSNEPCDSWEQFFAERRLMPLARRARHTGSLTTATITSIESLAARLSSVAPPAEPPSLLHGDLWAGNRIVDERGQSWLIDPACFGGHREFDLAMMHLFGGFEPEVFAAYDEVYPLGDGWQDRIALHQLPPLIVHAIKFGGGYPAAVDRALRRF